MKAPKAKNPKRIRVTVYPGERVMTKLKEDAKKKDRSLNYVVVAILEEKYK